MQCSIMSLTFPVKQRSKQHDGWQQGGDIWEGKEAAGKRQSLFLDLKSDHLFSLSCSLFLGFATL